MGQRGCGKRHLGAQTLWGRGTMGNLWSDIISAVLLAQFVAAGHMKLVRNVKELQRVRAQYCSYSAASLHFRALYEERMVLSCEIK